MTNAPREMLRPEEVLGERVRTLREERGWSQNDLANKMAEAGFSWRQSTSAKTESAGRPVRVDEAAALARLLGVSLNDLVRPKVSNLVTLMHRWQSTVESARRALADKELDYERAQAHVSAVEGKSAALRDLYDYMHRPQRGAPEVQFATVVREVITRFPGVEWEEILGDVGFDRGQLKKLQARLVEAEKASPGLRTQQDDLRSFLDRTITVYIDEPEQDDGGEPDGID